MKHLNFTITCLMFCFFCIHSSRADLLRPIKNKNPDKQAAVIWQGFDHGWNNTSHRLNHFQSRLTGTTNTSHSHNPKAITANYEAQFQVGAVRDSSRVKTKGLAIKSQTLRFLNGHTPENCLRISGVVGEASQAQCEIKIDVSNSEMKSANEITVVLAGFKITSVSHDAGYNTRGFAIRLIPKNFKNGFYTFEARAFIHPEHSPDRPLFDDKCKHGDHCEFYDYQVSIDYLLMGSHSAKTHFLEATEHASVTFEESVVMTPWKTPEPVSENLRQIHLDLETQNTKIIPAIQGFSFRLQDWPSTKKDGRYLRTLKLFSSDLELDSSKNFATLTPEFQFTNTSAWPYGYKSNYKIWTTFIVSAEQTLQTKPILQTAEILGGDSNVNRDFEIVF